MKFLLIDDHNLIRQAMQGVLRKLRKDGQVLEAASCGQANRILAENPDTALILLDLTLPDGDGLEFLEELRERYPATPVVVLSAVQDAANVHKALELGAAGYIPKTAESEVIVGALRLVMCGGIYIPPSILGGHAGKTLTVREALDDIGLSKRELDVLALIMQGKTNKTICRILDLSVTTVKHHVGAILKALNVNNRTEAVVAMAQRGWKPPAKSKAPETGPAPSRESY